MNTKKDLYVLAQEKNLPAFQRMDTGTIDWIEQNKPKFAVPNRMMLPDRKLLEQFVPKLEWFHEKKIFDTIHGMRHLLRVAVNAILIHDELASSVRLNNLIIAAVLHDIGREDDRGDSGHALRSTIWFKSNALQIGKAFGIKLDSGDIDEIYWSIYFHELPKSEYQNDNQYNKYKSSVDIIRMADALDRYRQPKLKWWIDEELLGQQVPNNFKETAFDLILDSEREYLDGKNSGESVLSILN